MIDIEKLKNHFNDLKKSDWQIQEVLKTGQML